jgi:hypothetical protein
VQGRYEVDFVVEVGRECLAIEVKSASRWAQGDTAGLRAFLEQVTRWQRGRVDFANRQPRFSSCGTLHADLG